MRLTTCDVKNKHPCETSNANCASRCVVKRSIAIAIRKRATFYDDLIGDIVEKKAHWFLEPRLPFVLIDAPESVLMTAGNDWAALASPLTWTPPPFTHGGGYVTGSVHFFNNAAIFLRPDWSVRSWSRANLKQNQDYGRKQIRSDFLKLWIRLFFDEFWAKKLLLDTIFYHLNFVVNFLQLLLFF